MPFKTDFGRNTQNKQKKSKLGHPNLWLSQWFCTNVNFSPDGPDITVQLWTLNVLFHPPTLSFPLDRGREAAEDFFVEGKKYIDTFTL